MHEQKKAVLYTIPEFYNCLLFLSYIILAAEKATCRQVASCHLKLRLIACYFNKLDIFVAGPSLRDQVFKTA